MIAVIDYGRGNLASVANALQRLGAAFRICSSPADLDACSALILPGVGAFDDAVRSLRAAGLEGPLRHFAEDGRPFLGICLGMQLLFERSDEGREEGLGWFRGEVLDFRRQLEADTTLKVPHMGWNRLQNCLDPLLPEGGELYFVHSYFVRPNEPELTSAQCHYGLDFSAAIRRGSLRAMQFHPEKSGPVGLGILQAFIEEAKEFHAQ